MAAMNEEVRAEMDEPIANGLARISVSLPAELARELDVMVSRRELSNRSQLLGELIRRELVGQIARDQTLEPIAGTITYVYRDDRGRVRQELAVTQFCYLKEVISSQHVFLEEDQSLEVLLVQGPARRLEELCDALRNIRGVQQLNMFTTTALLPPLHAHKEHLRKQRPSAKITTAAIKCVKRGAMARSPVNRPRNLK